MAAEIDPPCDSFEKAKEMLDGSPDGPSLDPDEQLVTARIKSYRAEFLHRDEKDVPQHSDPVAALLAAIWSACSRAKGQSWARRITDNPQFFRDSFCLEPTILEVWKTFAYWVVLTMDRYTVFQSLIPVFLLHGLAKELAHVGSERRSDNPNETGLCSTIRTSTVATEIICGLCDLKLPQATSDRRTPQQRSDDAAHLHNAINQLSCNSEHRTLSILITRMDRSPHDLQLFAHIVRQTEESILVQPWNFSECSGTLLTFCLSTELVKNQYPRATLALLHPEIAQDDGSGICVSRDADLPFFEKRLRGYPHSRAHSDVLSAMHAALHRQEHYKTNAPNILNSTLGPSLLPPLVAVVSSYTVVLSGFVPQCRNL